MNISSAYLTAAALVVSILVQSACNKELRGDGPPSTIENTVWIGTNKARGEIIEMQFGKEDAIDEDNLKFIFSSPAEGNVRDTVLFTGKYVYKYYPANNGTGTMKGDVSMDLKDVATGETSVASMSFHNRRFYLKFRNSAYPADRIEDSDYNSILKK